MYTKNILHMNLKNYRRQKGLSQTDVANHIGVSRQAISNWESQKAYPDLDNIVLLCELYGITTDELLGINTKEQLKEPSTTPNSLSEPQQDSKILGKSTQTILEILCLAVILVLASQFAVLGIFVPIILAIWLKKTYRHYKIIYVLCIICLLICAHNTYILIEHTFKLATPNIEYIE